MVVVVDICRENKQNKNGKFGQKIFKLTSSESGVDMDGGDGKGDAVVVGDECAFAGRPSGTVAGICNVHLKQF